MNVMLAWRLEAQRTLMSNSQASESRPSSLIHSSESPSHFSRSDTFKGRKRDSINSTAPSTHSLDSRSNGLLNMKTHHARANDTHFCGLGTTVLAHPLAAPCLEGRPARDKLNRVSLGDVRSEERRVGKECRTRWA